MNKAIFFDRDGVLIKSDIRNNRPFAIKCLDDICFTTNKINLFKKLRNLGFYLLLFTNQPDVARGMADKEAVNKINLAVKKYYKLDDIYVCFHDDHDQCECRKPKNGLIMNSSKRYQLKLEESYVIGDRWRDVDAANLSNCKSIFIDYKYSEDLKSKPTHLVYSIEEAINKILQIK